MNKLTYPAPFRDWQHGASIPWTPDRMSEYRAIGGWFPSPLPAAYDVTSAAKRTDYVDTRTQHKPTALERAIAATANMSAEERGELLEELGKLAKCD